LYKARQPAVTKSSRKKAMAYAMFDPEANKGGRCKQSTDSVGLSRTDLNLIARCPTLNIVFRSGNTLK
jgi:hypothetical protein